MAQPKFGRQVYLITRFFTSQKFIRCVSNDFKGQEFQQMAKKAKKRDIDHTSFDSISGVTEVVTDPSG